nr:MAG TPA: helix-turn-helix domain protein [Caudoviricetes sp.]
MDYKKISRICAEARISLGISQYYIAERLSITQQNISNFECGRNFSSRLLLFYISEILNGDDLDKIKEVVRNGKNNNRRNSSNGSSETPPST